MTFTPTNIIQVSDTVRLDRGPARKNAVATEELLADKITAAHYKAGQKDAMGKIIVLGEPMTYLDWKGDHGWYVYRLVNTEEPVNPKILAKIDPLHSGGELSIEDQKAVETGMLHRWMPVGFHIDKVEALALADRVARGQLQ